MGQIGQCIFGSALSHTRRSDPLEKKRKFMVTMGTGYRPEKKFWVPMGTGYRKNFHSCRPLVAWTFWPNPPVDKFRVLASIGYHYLNLLSNIPECIEMDPDAEDC